MELTTFVDQMRREYLLEGDYKAYRKHATRQLHAVRRRLGVCTPKGSKNVAKPNIGTEDIRRNAWFARIIVLSAERAWAHALTMKTSRPEMQGISGSTRRHVVSRLRKAVRFARALCAALHDQGTGHSQVIDEVEAEGYAAWLGGTLELNKHTGHVTQNSSDKRMVWQLCLQAFAKAYVVYTALFRATGKPIFKDFMENEVEPSLRYAAYQYGLARTLGTAKIARAHFPRDQKEVSSRIQHLDTNAFEDEQTTIMSADRQLSEMPTDINWRSHKSPIVDAAIGQAIAETHLAEVKLQETFKTALLDSRASAQTLAASYDNVLRACQDTVDTTRRVISELLKEGQPESDARMQQLRVADISVNYTLVSWRAGRNRVLAGGRRLDDGCTFNEERFPKKQKLSDGNESISEEKESTKHMRTRLQQRLVLYDSIIQSIDTLQTKRGANRDDGFREEMLGKRSYFTALKCLNIGFSYDLLGDEEKALALYLRGEKLSVSSRMALQKVTTSEVSDTSLPITLEISRQHQSLLGDTLARLVAKRRGAVALHSFARSGPLQMSTNEPLLRHLREYQGSGKVDLLSIVTYPPRFEPVSVKPIYLDLAWNSITYPWKREATNLNGMGTSILPEASVDKQSKDSKRRGWFEFGRS